MTKQDFDANSSAAEQTAPKSRIANFEFLCDLLIVVGIGVLPFRYDRPFGRTYLSPLFDLFLLACICAFFLSLRRLFFARIVQPPMTAARFTVLLMVVAFTSPCVVHTGSEIREQIESERFVEIGTPCRCSLGTINDTPVEDFAVCTSSRAGCNNQPCLRASGRAFCTQACTATEVGTQGQCPEQSVCTKFFTPAHLVHGIGVSQERPNFLCVPTHEAQLETSGET